MYNFYFESFGKAYIAHLDEPHKRSHIDILCPNSSSFLMEWDSCAYFSTISSKENDAKEVVLDKAEVQDKSLILKFAEKGNTKTSELTKKLDKFIILKKKNSKQTTLSIETSGNYEEVKIWDVVVIFKEYESTITFHALPQDDLYDVVLDFGSEASQMLISKGNPDAAVVPEKLFINTLSHFYNVQNVKGDRVYDQQDEDEKLFRSIFYLKKKAKMADTFEYDKPSRDDAFLSFMSKRTESHEGRIPNIKIAYLTGATVTGVNDMQTLHRGIVSRFFHEAVYRISELHKNKDKKVGINFTVLLPNVMPQSAVSSFLDNMRRVANSKEFLENNGSPLQVEYINVNSCSESDASFLECLHQAARPGSRNKMKVDPGKNYLIIDIGKGTTDFSIVELVSAQNARSKYRAGFVGAGNAISHAIFKNYMKTIAGEKYEILMKKMLNAEPAVLFDLENKIEDAKKNWSKGRKYETIGRISRVEAMEPEVLLEKIDEIGIIDDTQGEVAKMLSEISDKIMDQIPLDEVDYVVFSGRSFKFEQLKNQIEECLKKKLGKKVEVFFNSDTAKNGCLFGPLRNISLSLKNQMVGFPIVVDVTKLLKSEEDIKEKEDGVTKINTEAIRLANINKKRIGRWWKIFRGIFGDDSTSNEMSSLKGSNSINFDAAVKTFMTTGKEFRNLNENSRIIISGNTYTTGDQYLVRREEGPYYLYFDGSDYYLKHNTGCHKLVMQVNRGSQEMLAESQFPYSLLVIL